MYGATCQQCNSTELESDPSRGDTFCTKCGSVIEENLIVSELQFEEGSHGAANLIGRMVSSDAGYKNLSVGTLGNNLTVSSRESREITLENAKRRIRTIGQQLRLNNSCISTAFNFYKMALSRRLTYGRRQNNVFAACLYMTCRLEGTSHMLLDLSDATQVNIFDLGKTYLKLSSALCIQIPPVDPCIYVIRFSNRLHKLIGTDNNKIKDIEMIALRLVQRMKRDWMHTGRRPSGLCGAALLVACRLNGIHCNIRDIIKIVQVCETTIRKRLAEFGDTQTGRLTLDEFMTVDLEGEDDPPCFKEARKRQNFIMSQLESSGNLEEFEKEIAKFQDLIDDKLEKDRAVKQRRFKALLSDVTSGVAAKQSVPVRRSERNKRKLSESEEKTKEENNSETEDEDEEFITEDNVLARIIEHETAEYVSQVLDGSLINENNETALERLKSLRPTAKSLGLDSARQRCTNLDLAILNPNALQNDEIEDEDEEDGELDLTGIDDEEIDSYILSPEEHLARTDLWTKVNAEYLQEMKKKEAQEKAAEEERQKKGFDKHHPPKRRRVQRKKAPIVADSAAEAIEKMLHERKISSKINYEVLKNLNPTIQRLTSDLEDVD